MSVWLSDSYARRAYKRAGVCAEHEGDRNKMNSINQRLDFSELDELLKNVDMDVFMTHVKRGLEEAAKKKRRAAPLRPLPPRRVEEEVPDVDRLITTVRRELDDCNHWVIGQMPWDAETYCFQVYSNDGGPRHVDCGIIALRKAMDLLPNRPAALAEAFFTASPEEIREELVQMFAAADNEMQLLMANQYLPSTDNASLDDIRARVTRCLRSEMLNWQTLVQYIEWKFPGQINAVIWKEQPNSGNAVLFEGGTVIDPNLPILHVIHYNRQHFEALNPFEDAAVACAIKGRVDNATQYLVDIDDRLVELFVAPHPAVEGQTLLRIGGESAVYTCEADLLFALKELAPTDVGVSCSFNYHKATAVPEYMVQGINEFILLQGITGLNI